MRAAGRGGRWFDRCAAVARFLQRPLGSIIVSTNHPQWTQQPVDTRGPQPRAEPLPVVPALFVGLLDDAAVFPPGSTPLPEAVREHRAHRSAWYAPLVGPLLVPAIDVGGVWSLLEPGERLAVGLIGVVGEVAGALSVAGDQLEVSQIESPVAKRGEDPMPGLRAFLTLARDRLGYAEIPLTGGLLNALDSLAEERLSGARVAPKFRTGGLAAELFPTPVELAALMCACRERQLPFKLTAGLHRAIRHTDPETGFTHHGFLNVLSAAITAADGAEVVEVAETLACIDAEPLVQIAAAKRHEERPLWVGFGSCSVAEPLDDLRRLGLLGPQASA
jgi:hypothetical protein